MTVYAVGLGKNKSTPQPVKSQAGSCSYTKATCSSANTTRSMLWTHIWWVAPYYGLLIRVLGRSWGRSPSTPTPLIPRLIVMIGLAIILAATVKTLVEATTLMIPTTSATAVIMVVIARGLTTIMIPPLVMVLVVCWGGRNSVWMRCFTPWCATSPAPRKNSSTPPQVRWSAMLPTPCLGNGTGRARLAHHYYLPASTKTLSRGGCITGSVTMTRMLGCITPKTHSDYSPTSAQHKDTSPTPLSGLMS